MFLFAPQREGAAVREEDALVGIDRVYRVANRVEHFGQPAFRGRNRGHRLAADPRHREMQPDPRQQLARPDRCGQIVVGAAVQRRIPPSRLGIGPQQDHRQPAHLRLGAQQAQKRQAAAARQFRVGDNQVGRVAQRRGQRRGAVADGFDGAAGGIQHPPQPGARLRIGAGDDDARGATVR